jgi:hypothetical protein
VTNELLHAIYYELHLSGWVLVVGIVTMGLIGMAVSFWLYTIAQTLLRIERKIPEVSAARIDASSVCRSNPTLEREASRTLIPLRQEHDRRCR